MATPQILGINAPSLGLTIVTLFIRWRIAKVPHYVSTPGVALGAGLCFLTSIGDMRTVTIIAAIAGLALLAFAVEWQIANPHNAVASGDTSGGKKAAQATRPHAPASHPALPIGDTAQNSTASPGKRNGEEPDADRETIAKRAGTAASAAPTTVPIVLASVLPIESYWDALGCASPPGVPDQITPYTGLDDGVFKAKLHKLTISLREFEKIYSATMNEAMSADYGEDDNARKSGIEAASKAIGDEYHAKYGDQPIGALREVLKRLNMPSPQSTASGLSKDGFAAVCFQNSLRGAHPLSDLSNYLDALAAQLPS